MTDDDIRDVLRAKAAEATVSDDAWGKIAARLAEPAPKVTHLPRRLAAAAVVAAAVAGVVVVANNREPEPNTPVASSTSTTGTFHQTDPAFVRSVVEDWAHARVPGVVLGTIEQTDHRDGTVSVRFTGGDLATDLFLRPTNGGQGLEVASAASDLVLLDDPTYDGHELVAEAVPAVEGRMTTTYRFDGQVVDGGTRDVTHETQPLGYRQEGADAVQVQVVLTTADGTTGVAQQDARVIRDPGTATGSYVSVWPATDAVGLSTLQTQVDEDRRGDLEDPQAVAGGFLSELLPRNETPTSFALGEFEQGDPSSGEVPYTLSDGSKGTVLVRTLGGPRPMWFVSGATSEALEIAKVRPEPEDLVVDVQAAVGGTLTWVGATPVEVQAGQKVGISRHDGPTVETAYPIVIRLMDGTKTLGIVARLP